MPAEKLEEVFDFFQNYPLKIDEFDKFYVEADEGRGKPDHIKLKRLIEARPEGSLKMLFAGHKGCGKSTELMRLQKSIEKDFVVLNFSILEELDILNISYIEIFIATMEKLFELLKKEKKICIDNRDLENITNWVKSREILEINQDFIGLDIEGEVKVGLQIPFLANFFTRFKSAAKSSSSLKEVLTNKVEPKLSDLIRSCNQLINKIKTQLPKINKKGMILIIEDMDKVDMKKGEEIFYIHSTQLTQLNCHCIFTFPIALLYHHKFKAIAINYQERFILPMVKVFEKNGGPFDEGIEIMRKVVEKRMDISLFDSETLMKGMIKDSGGCFWDLFRMVKDAADNALIFGRTRINQEDYESARKALKADYERTLAENKEKGITVDDYYDTLCSCALDEKKKPKITDVLLDLMNNLTVLNYNGDNWHDVHPMVKEILRERGII